MLYDTCNQGWQPAFTAGIIRRLKPDKAVPDNTPKSVFIGFYSGRKRNLDTSKTKEKIYG